MAFQPFGFRFEITSLSAPSEVKAAIRSSKKSWFDPQNGARGWIAGPFICLWFSAYDRYGPMLFGRISRDNFGTKISGRAGSDLNGLVILTFLLPLIISLLWEIIASGDYTPMFVASIGGVILLCLSKYWVSYKSRKEAEPLVRFLRRAATMSGQSVRAKLAHVNISRAFSLKVGEKEHKGPLTSEIIYEALFRVGAGDCAILYSAPERYIQTAWRDGGLVLEMRQGDHFQHFQAVRRDAAPVLRGHSNCIFTFEEVLAAFLAYGSEAQMPHFLKWEPLALPVQC